MLIYQNLPIITIQDPKHTKKTARNQLHSGIRLLILGNNVILYRHLLTLAQAENHAIYIRDVVNVDKQDDGAAYRLFHSDVLEQICQNHEQENNEMQSLFVYLFVLGV
jgi:choline kinase